VIVKVESEASGQANGLVNVTLPKSAVGAPTKLTIGLPDQIASQISNAASVSATMFDGSPLPSWLLFDLDNQLITATSVPEGVLPIRVLVTIGEDSWVIVFGAGEN
jgi:hypothetical protein